MATTKSTVVGIRLDHERRAWVEGEAARLGVSVRGLFEGMIDEARAGETAGATRAIAGLGPMAQGAAEAPPGEEATATPEPEEGATGAAARVVNTESSSPFRALPGRSLFPDFGSVTGLPAGLLRGACSLTASLIESSSRCATKRLGGCVFTRNRSDRSV
jgi:hypothetical protein